MERCAYRIHRKTDEALFQQEQAGRHLGNMTVGTDHLFWKKGLSRYAMPYSDIRRYWRRIEQVNGKTGCCSNDFSMHFLIVRTDEEELKLSIGDSLYRQEPEQLMEALAELLPDVPSGKPQE